MAKKEYKLKIFDVLRQADKKNYQYYASLTEEEKKAIPFPVILRWMSSVDGNRDLQEYHVAMADESNQYIYQFYREPELLWKLLCVVGTGSSQRHNWIPNSPKETPITKLVSLLKQKFPLSSHEELLLSIKQSSMDDIREFCARCGLTDSEMKEMEKEYKKL